MNTRGKLNPGGKRNLALSLQVLKGQRWAQTSEDRRDKLRLYESIGLLGPPNTGRCGIVNSTL